MRGTKGITNKLEQVLDIARSDPWTAVHYPSPVACTWGFLVVFGTRMLFKKILKIKRDASVVIICTYAVPSNLK